MIYYSVLRVRNIRKVCAQNKEYEEKFFIDNKYSLQSYIHYKRCLHQRPPTNQRRGHLAGIHPE